MTFIRAREHQSRLGIRISVTQVDGAEYWKAWEEALGPRFVAAESRIGAALLAVCLAAVEQGGQRRAEQTADGLETEARRYPGGGVRLLLRGVE